MAAPIGRRQALQVVLAGVPLVALSRPGEALLAPLAPAAPPPEPHPASAAPAAEMRPEPPLEAPPASAAAEAPLPELVPGLRVGPCKVVKVGDVVAGGVPVLLQAPDGSQFGVDILRHDRSTPGVARGGRLAVFLNNDGKGNKASIEPHGLGAMALARWLELRESNGCPVPSLLTLRQRAPLLAMLQA